MYRSPAKTFLANKSLLPLLPLLAAAAAWLVPGAGHWALGRNRHAAVILVCVTLLFLSGLYIGSVAVIDPQREALWYYAQVLASPAVILVSRISSEAVYGRPNEIGQIYTSVAGLLNLLCIFHAIVLAERERLDGGATERRDK